jgi:hypothetical protein
LLIGFAIVFFFSSAKVSSGFAVSPDCEAVYARHYKDTRRARQAKNSKKHYKNAGSRNSGSKSSVSMRFFLRMGEARGANFAAGAWLLRPVLLSFFYAGSK